MRTQFLNISILNFIKSPKKWSGQNRTSWTGSYAYDMLQLGGHRKCCGVKYSTGVGVRQAFMYAQMFLLSYKDITTNWRLLFIRLPLDRQWQFQSCQVTQGDDTRSAHGKLMGGEKSSSCP